MGVNQSPIICNVVAVAHDPLAEGWDINIEPLILNRIILQHTA
jgi:hypothetical protein